MRAGATSMARPTGQPIALPGRNLRKSLGGFGWAALSVTVFSGRFVATRFSVTHDLRIWDVLALRFGGGALILLPVSFRRASRLPGRAWLEGLLFAALWGRSLRVFRCARASPDLGGAGLCGYTSSDAGLCRAHRMAVVV